jgi:hypothetical protein
VGLLGKTIIRNWLVAGNCCKMGVAFWKALDFLNPSKRECISEEDSTSLKLDSASFSVAPFPNLVTLIACQLKH